LSDQATIDGEIVRLQPIARAAALALLAGKTPDWLRFAAGYPSQFSLEVMDLLAGARSVAAGAGFTPWFVTRKDNGLVVGEMGYGLDAASGTATLGYSIVEPSWGLGYASDGLRALLEHLRGDPRVHLMQARTMVQNHASRRVMEKAGMQSSGHQIEEVDGELFELVVYELESR
jgi:ribosomal-protein-alanine N-acetyltransferase